MHRHHARAALALGLSLVLLARPGAAAPADADEERARATHALNRLAFGPRPGELEQVLRMGLARWISQQLEPERLADAQIPERLAGLAVLQKSTAEILKGYELPLAARREAQKRRAELEDASEEQQRALRQELRQKYMGAMEGTPRQVLDELQAAKLIRAVHSERQLDEVLVDFWMNHFNVYAQKGPVRFLLNEYEQKVVRPRAWGRFEDLLVATAESPAMLFYLDNWLSADPQGQERRARQRGSARGGFGGGAFGQGGFGSGRRGGFGGPAGGRPEQMRPPGGQSDANPPAGRRAGLNENYARELMELHTLGVDGGYTQKDVTEVARAFTGWTIRGLQQNKPQFAFEQRLHAPGDKLVLGQVVKAGGQDEGRQILHLLATQPATARFISYKLARRFVSDEPPAALVERAAKTFRRTEGDLREVVRAIVTSAEFQASTARQAKIKTPLEFVASAVRAAGGQVRDARELSRRLGEMGMPLYLQQPPTGYKDTAEAWVSTGGLLARLNFALDLADGRVAGVTLDSGFAAAPAGGLAALRDQLAARLVPAGLSAGTLEAIAQEDAASLKPARLAGLILGSPEFQRR